MGKLKINLSQAFAGQKVGVKQIEDRIWRKPSGIPVLSAVI